MQEAIELGEIDLWCWCATTDMIADCTTKWMVDELLQVWYRTGVWEPKETLIFEHAMRKHHEIRNGFCDAKWGCPVCWAAKNNANDNYRAENEEETFWMGFLNYVYMQNFGILNTPILEDAEDKDADDIYNANTEEEKQHEAIQKLIVFYEEWGY